MENISDLFYEKLTDTKKPGSVLATFYERLFNLPYSLGHIIMFNKLTTAYGRYIPFFAILDVHAYDKADVSGNVFGLLSFFCKKRFEQRSAIVVLNDAYKNLDSTIEKIQGRVDAQRDNPVKARKLK